MDARAHPAPREKPLTAARGAAMAGAKGCVRAAPLVEPAAALRAMGRVQSARAVYSSVAGGIVTDP